MFLRRTATIGLAAGLATATLAYNRRSNAAFCASADGAAAPAWPFDTKGLPVTFDTSKVVSNAVSNPVHLVGVGMRRKLIIIAEFDIYLIGVGLSAAALRKSAEWVSTPEESRRPLSTYVVGEDTPSTVNGKSVKAALVLHMVRAVTKDQFIEAFRVAFEGVNQDHFETFKTRLVTCMGESTMNPKEEIHFYWLSDGNLVFAKNGEVKGDLKNQEIALRLFDVYCDPKRTVSKDFYQNLNQNLSKVKDMVVTK
jgi:hypothetical protein